MIFLSGVFKSRQVRHSMYFANPWGLLGLLAIPTIAAIHLYQRRYPPMPIAGLHLWVTETPIQAPGRRRDKLPWTRTLLIELLLALFLSIILADPRLGEWDKATHLVAILDHSASMQAQPPGGQSFRDSAIKELEKRFLTLQRKSVITLIRTGFTPVTLIRRGTLEEARKVLQLWNPTAPRHRFAPAWEELGQQLVEESGQIVFLTDNLLDPAELPQNLEVISFGRQLHNIAFDAARWTFDSLTQKGQLFVRVHNYGNQAAECTVVFRTRDQVIAKRPLKISPDTASALELSVPGGISRLTLNLEADEDGTAFDNTIELVEPKIRSVKAAVEFPKGGVQAELGRVLKITPDVSIVPSEKAQLVFAPASQLPASNPQLWWFGIGPLKNGDDERKASKDIVGPYLIDKRHPLVEGVSLGGIVWGGIQPVKLDLTPIVSAGNSMLLGQLRGTRSTAFLMNVDLSRSNIEESPDWPVLVTNLIEQRRDALPGLRRWNYRLGEVVRFRLYEGNDPDPQASLSISGPQPVRRIPRDTFVEIGELNEPGIYELRQGDQLLGNLAMNFFDPVESDLRGLRPGQRAAIQSGAGSTTQIDNPYTWATWIGSILILVCLFADWFVLRPRAVESNSGHK